MSNGLTTTEFDQKINRSTCPRSLTRFFTGLGAELSGEFLESG